VEWRAFVREHPYGNLYDWLQYIKAENKQGNISAEECREIIKMMSLKSFEADYKILIIWMPELLKEQGNRLLKLIEEPPPQTLFLFVAENEQQLLPTILSRVQLIKIAPLSQEEIEKALRLNYDATNETAERVAVESEGNFREALQLLQYADNDWERNLREWLNSCLKAGPAAQVKWIDEISKIGREKQKQFFKYFLHVIEFAVKSRMTDESSIMASHPSSLMDLADRFNKICKVEQLEAIATELDKAYYYIERNANAKLLFHALTIKLYHIISNKSVILAH
jgi:DNA polymerase-3 subunit delta'